MAEFHITSTIAVEAETEEDLHNLLTEELRGEGNHSFADDLLRNAEIDEA